MSFENKESKFLPDEDDLLSNEDDFKQWPTRVLAAYNIYKLCKDDPSRCRGALKHLHLVLKQGVQLVTYDQSITRIAIVDSVMVEYMNKI